jgi:hypothetical protein
VVTSGSQANVNSVHALSQNDSGGSYQPMVPKTEIPGPSNPSISTDDTDSETDKMSPINTSNGMPLQTVQIPVDSHPIVVPVGQNPNSVLPYSSSGIGYPNMHPYSFLPEGDDLPPLPSEPNDGISPGGPVALVQEAARKREVRLLKNREAARECRRKKKEYIKCLENRVQVLESQNKALIDELKNLKEMYCHNQP